MKRILIASVLTMASLGAMAAKPLANEAACMAVSSAAEDVMEYRQTDGKTIGAMFKHINETEAPESFKNLAKEMTIDAFDNEPSWGSPKYKSKAISEFSSEYFIECLEDSNGEF